MITDRKTLQMYLDADKFALGINKRFPFFSRDEVWKFERLLRFYEYYRNTGHYYILRLWYAYRLERLGKRLGFTIGANCFGPGLRINHHGLLLVNSKATIGKWCDVHQGVNIGDNGYIDEKGCVKHLIPTIGNFVYIGPGAKIYGAISVGDRVRVGANAIVRTDIVSNCVVFGNNEIGKSASRRLLTIAEPMIEKEFLNKYPQYQGLI